MDIGVDEPDHAARSLYESMGFSNRAGGPAGSLMYVYGAARPGLRRGAWARRTRG